MSTELIVHEMSPEETTPRNPFRRGPITEPARLPNPRGQPPLLLETLERLPRRVPPVAAAPVGNGRAPETGVVVAAVRPHRDGPHGQLRRRRRRREGWARAGIRG